uniref:Putative terminase n=1 Tax=viral metagenome TaxID=1070528 RepID=A0A6M3L965_9ZZZZ
MPGDYAWIAPIFATTERGVDAMRTIADPPLAEIRGSSPRYADVMNGRSRIFYLSADKPDGIRGYGFRGVVIDEAAMIDKVAWDYVIRPALTDYAGWGLMLGTPKGRNHFFDWWTRGQDAGEPEWASLSFPSASNPYLPAGEIAAAQAGLPADAFRQEYLAEFLEDHAGVFRGIDDCLTQAPCTHSGPFVVGCDLAKHQDFTVLVALCEQCGCGRQIDRFNRIDWPEQKFRIRAFCARWSNAQLYVDATGVGDPIYDDLRAAGLNVRPFKFGAQSKRALVQALMVAVEQRMIRWPVDWEVLTNELRRYEYQYSRTGEVHYSAPEGYHDDCVMALGLATMGLRGFIRPQVFDSASGSSAAKLRASDKRLDELIGGVTDYELREELTRLAEQEVR